MLHSILNHSCVFKVCRFIKSKCKETIEPSLFFSIHVMVCCQPGSKPVAAQSTYCQLDSVGTSFGYLKKKGKRKKTNANGSYFFRPCWVHYIFIRAWHLYATVDGILPKGPYPPCLRMADRALLAGYPRNCRSCRLLRLWPSGYGAGSMISWLEGRRFQDSLGLLGLGQWDATDAIPMALSNRLASRAMTTDDRPNSFVFSYLLHHVHGPRLIDQSVAMQICHALSPGQNTEQPLRVDIKRSTQM